VRLFVAVNLSAPARAAIQSAIDDFPIADPPWRWVGPENWHLTLKFLGETRPERLDALVTSLASAAARHPAFDLALGAFGGFPNLRSPRVLDFNVEGGHAPLEALARDIDAAVERATGLPLETRRFHAHATLARVKDRLPPDVASRLARIPALTDAVTRVDRFELMESHLQRTGAVYSVVKEFALP
jgi:2'-5' RNA ligase